MLGHGEFLGTDQIVKSELTLGGLSPVHRGFCDERVFVRPASEAGYSDKYGVRLETVPEG